jgi:predicted phage-related endonuclease
MVGSFATIRVSKTTNLASKGETTMSTDEIVVIAREYRELKAEIKNLEDQMDALKQQLIREMDEWNMSTVSAGEYTIRYDLYESSRLDSKALKADHADLYSQYSKKTVSTRFQVA